MAVNNLTRNNIVLLLCLLALIFFNPLPHEKLPFLQDLLMTAVLYSGIFSLDFSPKALKILLPLGTISAATLWTHHFFPGYVISLIDFISTVLFLITIVVLMIRHIAQSQNVTVTIILNSINGYLLLGVLGGVMLVISDVIYRFTHASGEHAIDFTSQSAPQLFDFIYFSFVIITTLGFGDITPVSYLARSFSILIAITGQLYMTILIAMLVGKFIAQPKGK